jgi:hypothetical protein
MNHRIFNLLAFSLSLIITQNFLSLTTFALESNSIEDKDLAVQKQTEL